MTPKEKANPNYCSRHPDYKGARLPKTNCYRCTEKYHRLRGQGVKFNIQIPSDNIAPPKRKINRIVVRGTKVVYYPGVGKPFKEGPSAR